MATRSRIAIEFPDGTVESIYCHWDGYPEYNGKMLQQHYQDRTKVEELIQLGDISFLDQKIEPTGEHSFEKPETGVTVAYARDRGELKRIRKNWSREAFLKSDIEEFGYLFTKENEWIYVSDCDRNPRKLPVS